MTPENMLTVASVGFILICWAVERPAWLRWVGLILCVVVVGVGVAHARGQQAQWHHRRGEGEERRHQRRTTHGAHHRRR
jgi:hypothetical protein